MLEQYTIRDVKQLKALSHAARVRILGALTDKPMTAKQLADLFGEEPAKTSYHVKQLLKVGLVELVFTRETRNGIVEKYYQAVAKEFQTDPYLAQNPPPEGGLEASFVRALSQAQSDFLRAYRERSQQSKEKASPDTAWGLERIAADVEQVRQFQTELKALLKRFAPAGDDASLTFHYLLFPNQR